jgi:putative transposase
MPTHVHLLICPLIEKYSISKILSGIKLPFSMRMSKLSKENRGAPLGHFWQRGGGYDRNLVTKKAIEVSIDYIHGNPVRKGACQFSRGMALVKRGVLCGF